MRNILLPAALAAVLLGGCATSRTIIGQDGKPLHKISCDGSALSVDACYEKAGELCASAGYDVVNQHDTITPLYYGGLIVTRDVLVRCRVPS